MAAGIILKTCTKCKKPKPLTEFYKDNSAADKHTYECKDCRREYKQSPKGREVFAKSGRKYSKSEKAKSAYHKYKHSLKGKLTARKATHKYQQKHPDHIRAQASVQYAIATGRLLQVSALICKKCGAKAEHYHHHLGYAREHYLDVIPLCDPCHKAEHSIV